MRVVFIFSFVVSIVMNIVFISFQSNFFLKYSNVLLNSDNYEKLRSITLLITAFISIINLSWVIIYAISENRRKQKNNDISKLSFWFRDIVLKNNTGKINVLFDKILVSLNLLKENRNINKYNEINEEFRIAKQNLIYSINDQLININKDFAEDLDIELDNFEDDFTHKLEEYLTEPSNDKIKIKSLFEELISIVNKYKRVYTGMLFHFEMEGYKYKKRKEEIAKKIVLKFPKNTNLPF